MLIKELTLEKRIRIIDNGSLDSEYKNKIFALDPNDEDAFIDWLNGSLALGFTKKIQDNHVVVESLADAHAFKGWDQLAENSVAAYVRTKLLMRIYTFRGELSYPQENTSNVGCPPLFKKRQLEVDLILKSIILETPGVVEIKEFISNVVNRTYTAEVVILCEGGEMLWQAIAI